jgi:hypothetical protein
MRLPFEEAARAAAGPFHGWKLESARRKMRWI